MRARRSTRRASITAHHSVESVFFDDAIAELQAEDPEIGKAYEVMNECLDTTTDELRALPLESHRVLSMQPEIRLYNVTS